MKFSIRYIVLQFFFLCLGAYLVYQTIEKISDKDWEYILVSYHAIDWYLVLVGVFIILMGNICRSERWLLLVDNKTEKRFSFKRSLNTLGAVCIGYLVNLLVPRLGEVVRCTTLAKYEKNNATELIGTIILERIFDFICLIIIFILVIFFESEVIVNHVKMLAQRYWQRIDIYVLLAILTMIILGIVMVFRLIIPRFPILKKWMNSIGQGFWSFRHVRHKWKFLVYTTLMWLCYVASLRFSFVILPGFSGLGWEVALQLLAVGSIAMIITQGGVGAYPLMIMQMLSLEGVPIHEGFMLGWFCWIFMSLCTIGFGVIFYLYLPYLNKSRS